MNTYIQASLDYLIPNQCWPKGARHYLVKAKQSIKLQIYWALFFSIIAWIVWGKQDATSILLGATTYIVPTLYYARKLFSQTGAQWPKAIIRSVYLAEIKKLVLFSVLCVLCFRALPIKVEAFFGGMIMSQWVFILVNGFNFSKN